MMLVIDGLLAGADLAGLRDGLAAASWSDGKLTAGSHAKLVKDNEQLTGEVARPFRDGVDAALRASEPFQLCVLPRSWAVLFNRYAPGMAYGAHVDNAFMGDLRSDVSFTLFLSEPGSYDGGELIMQTSLGDQAVKLMAGSAFVYPSTTLHRVAPVSRGVRLAVVGWVQSHVRDAAEREILWDLERARRTLLEQGGKTVPFDLVAKTRANLLRKWGES